MGSEVTEGELVRSLRHLAAELGRSPSQADINEYSPHSHQTYYRRFDGGMQEAKRRVGLETYAQQGRERVTVECANCGAELERQPSEVDAAAFSYCDQDCHYEHKRERYAGDGNPQSTLEAVECFGCGTMLQRPAWKRRENNHHYCANCWGNTTVEITCKQCGDIDEVIPSLAEAGRQFCSVECHGKWLSEYQTGDRHPRWNPDKERLYYGPNWQEQRVQAISRDVGRCQRCGLPEHEHVEQWGVGLHVHHETPLRAFKADGEIDYAEANALANLTTVCLRCHYELESNS